MEFVELITQLFELVTFDILLLGLLSLIFVGAVGWVWTSVTCDKTKVDEFKERYIEFLSCVPAAACKKDASPEANTTPAAPDTTSSVADTTPTAANTSSAKKKISSADRANPVLSPKPKAALLVLLAACLGMFMNHFADQMLEEIPAYGLAMPTWAKEIPGWVSRNSIWLEERRKAAAARKRAEREQRTTSCMEATSVEPPTKEEQQAIAERREKEYKEWLAKIGLQRLGTENEIKLEAAKDVLESLCPIGAKHWELSEDTSKGFFQHAYVRMLASTEKSVTSMLRYEYLVLRFLRVLFAFALFLLIAVTVAAIRRATPALLGAIRRWRSAQGPSDGSSTAPQKPAGVAPSKVISLLLGAAFVTFLCLGLSGAQEKRYRKKVAHAYLALGGEPEANGETDKGPASGKGAGQKVRESKEGSALNREPVASATPAPTAANPVANPAAAPPAAQGASTKPAKKATSAEDLAAEQEAPFMKLLRPFLVEKKSSAK